MAPPRKSKQSFGLAYITLVLCLEQCAGDDGCNVNAIATTKTRTNEFALVSHLKKCPYSADGIGGDCWRKTHWVSLVFTDNILH
ncbi:MAG: hypothetical protein VKJ64_08180 [Leptolyngbyaceae bacterium]|nr:hypothetical protein [Leptolyngbyaceae bacterium]